MDTGVSAVLLRCLQWICFDEHDFIYPRYRLGAGPGKKDLNVADQLVELLELTPLAEPELFR